MIIMMQEKTKPKLRFPPDYKIDPHTLAASRYGTLEMVQLFGPEKKFEQNLKAQGQSALTMNRLYPNVEPRNIAQEIAEKASLKYIDPNRIRLLEDATGHDVIAVNTALEEVLSLEAKPYVNKAKTGADTTQPAIAMQLKEALEVTADSIENLRDITLEKAVDWIKIPYMVVTHGIDALPSVAGRPLAFYAEMLQSNLNFIKFVHDNSLMAKWADVTGDHHSSKALGIDGIKLQEEYCKDLGVGHMIAPAQIPGLEFEADVFYSMARTGETLNNISHFIEDGKGSDVDVFKDNNPKKRKGSSGMPHKDAKGGNPTTEEQDMSLRNYLEGLVQTALANCEMPYARNLAASANARINFDNGFKFLDHGIRNLASTIYWTDLDEQRSRERVSRSYGVVTSEQVLTYLTDSTKVSNPMPRSEAHNLIAELATEAWKTKTQFFDVLKKNDKVANRIDETTLIEITDPFKFLGESEKIVNTVFERFHKKKTLS